MLTHVIETATPGLIVLLAVSLVIAGLVKGAIGVGMPTVAFPLLSMLVDTYSRVAGRNGHVSQNGHDPWSVM